MLDLDISDLPAALDQAVLAEDKPGQWQLVAGPPGWFLEVYAGIDASGGFSVEDSSPFLATFLANARDFLRRNPGGRLRSGPWIEVAPDGAEIALDATGLLHHGRPLLILTRLGEEYVEKQRILQRAREGSLRYRRLEGLRDDLVLVLDQLEVGALITDVAGRVVFISEPARRLFAIDEEHALGRRWQELEIFDGASRRLLEEAAALPPSARRRVPSHWERPDGRAFWMDVDLRDDPRDARRKILFLYDASALHDLRRLLDSQERFEDMVGKSAAMGRVYELVDSLASVDTTVLIEGETGRGKELGARAIHRRSARRGRPFVPVNCAGLTESLVNSQLFGHRRGAFTGAVQDSRGLFEAAEGGVLFLDEIGDVPPGVQPSLLRVLEDREVTPVGDTRPRKVDVRVLAATHRDLGAEVGSGRFRADLLYRVRVARIRIPPLRERPEDIPALVARFLADFRASSGKQVLDISADAMRVLMRQPWSGNVRELRATVECGVIACRRSVLDVSDLPIEPLPAPAGWSSPASTNQEAAPPGKDEILAALQKAGGARTRAAKLLGISRATLYRRMSHLGISSPR